MPDAAAKRQPGALSPSQVRGRPPGRQDRDSPATDALSAVVPDETSARRERPEG
jgi:hypothetical protein